MFSKIISFFAGIFMFISSFLGLGGAAEKKNPPEKTAVIALAENPTTGYQWEYSAPDEKIAKVIGDEYKSDADGDEAVCGAGGTRTVTIEGVSRGTATMVFKYKRSWENDAIRTVIYVVTVDSEKNVSVNTVSDISK